MSFPFVMRCVLLGSIVAVAACRVAPESTESARLSWVAPAAKVDGSPLQVTAYRIYFGMDPDRFSHRIDIPDPSARNWTVTGLTPGTWYFAVTAVDRDGSESTYSSIGSKTVE